MPWKNRIVGYGEEAPEQLLANEKNWRGHPKPQQDALSGVLREVGIVQNILVNKRTGSEWPEGERNVETMIDGHLRVALAISEGQPTVPITYVDLTPAEENEILATLDPLAAMAFTDAAKLDELLRDVQSGEAAVQDMIEQLAIRQGLIEPQDPLDLWQGMPEFAQGDKTALQSIHVHFENKDAVDAFAELIGQKLTDRTRSIWYPEIKIERYADKRYSDES
jgi:hypothetical protein